MPALRSIRLAVVAVTLVALTASCTDGRQPASGSRGIDQGAIVEPPASGPSTTTTTLTVEQLVLGPDGLGPVTFGTQAARALNALTQALGRAEAVNHVPAGARCDATRIFSWKDLDVAVNEVGASSGGRPGLAGWLLRAGEAPTLGLTTENGIGLGSTVAAIKAAYGSSVSVAAGGSGPVVTITTPTGVITGELDGPGEEGKVRALRAGEYCGA